MDQSTDSHVVPKQQMKWKEHGRMNSETSGNPRNGYLDLELGKVQRRCFRDKEILKSSDLSEGIPLKEPYFWILIFHFFTSSL